MAETIMLLDDERPAHTAGSEPQTLEWSVLTALGTLRLAPTPTVSVQKPGCEPPVAPLPIFTATEVTPTPCRRRRYISARCYDLGYAVITLTSAAVALYRLVWMGQP